jgi:hypothetical protein
MPRPSLVTRIQADPVYRAVIRLVGYLGINYAISREETDRLCGDFGKTRNLTIGSAGNGMPPDKRMRQSKPI